MVVIMAGLYGGEHMAGLYGGEHMVGLYGGGHGWSVWW